MVAQTATTTLVVSRQSLLSNRGLPCSSGHAAVDLVDLAAVVQAAVAQEATATLMRTTTHLIP